MFPTRAGACGRALVGASESTGRAAAAPMHGTASGNFAGLLRPPRILDPPGPGVDAAPGPGTFRGTLAQADSLRLRAYARESLTRCSNASRLILGASDSCGMHMCLSVQSLLLRLSLSRQLQSEPRTARRPGRTRCMALRPQHEHRRRVHLRLDWEWACCCGLPSLSIEAKYVPPAIQCESARQIDSAAMCARCLRDAIEPPAPHRTQRTTVNMR